MKKTIVITGATGGIGKSTAIALAQLGNNNIIIQGRDAAKGNSNAAEISAINGSTCTFIQADLSTIVGIKKFAADVQKTTDKIDVLIHSAGMLNAKRRENKDGLDEVFTVNYLCKFIMNNLLIEELKKGEGKIIMVGGLLTKGVDFSFEDLQLRKNYSVSNRMGQNKLSVHMNAEEFARRFGAKPSINVVHPGVIKTEISRNLNWITNLGFSLLVLLKGNSMEKAIANIVSLATAENVGTGYFYPKLDNTSVKEKINLDAAKTARLWDESLKIAKI